MNVVVDSSVIIKWLNSDHEKDLNRADKILQDAQQNIITLIAPEIAKYEVGNALLLSKKLTPVQAKTPLKELFNFPIMFVSESAERAIQTFTIASNFGITYYDASFLSLAKEYDAVLVTDNIKHQGKTKTVTVIPLSEYRSQR